MGYPPTMSRVSAPADRSCRSARVGSRWEQPPPTSRLGDHRAVPTRSSMLDDELTAAPDWTSEFTDRAARAGEDIATALSLAAEYGTRLPLPAGGATLTRGA